MTPLAFILSVHLGVAALLLGYCAAGWWNERLDVKALKFEVKELELENQDLRLRLDDERRRDRRLHVIRGGDFTDDEPTVIDNRLDDERDTEPPEAG